MQNLNTFVIRLIDVAVTFREINFTDLEETELRKADRTVGVNCNIFSNISSGTA